ncbi:MAG: cysteine desulfurase NifS [Acidobacteria bacterium]|nr:cysteine desulfurase NifS [Acidobacteriota bacterium]MCI0724412.1 cysteine desulfurase NifS [Acidobacteriota bacterium]
MQRIYLDNNATTRVAPEVLQAMLPCYQDAYGNASSVHAFGQEAKGLLDNARQQVACLLGAEPNEIVFTSGGTESDNLAIRGIVEASPRPNKHVITTQIEHHAVLHTCQALQKAGVRVTCLPVDGEGRLDPADVRHAITPETVLISVMQSNNEIGTTQPLREIGQIALEHDVCFHSDAVQAAGKLPLCVDDLNLDLLCIAGHKFHAPKGVGALYVRKGTRLRPLFFGGAHERNRRAGTENIPQVTALGAAAELARQNLDNRARSIGELRDYFEREVFQRIPEVALNGSPTARISNTSNLRFERADSESLVINLDLAGIACSTGSACASGSIEPSHVLLALGLPVEQAFSSVRFSLSRYTTREEIEAVLEVLPGIVSRCREASPTSARLHARV